MKIVHHNKEWQDNKVALSTQAKKKETASEWAEAAGTYEKLLKQHPLNESVYERLMILYRKLKDPKKELQIINQGIKTFETLYTRKQKNSGAKVISLSRALQKATGLVDKKGRDLYEPQPLAKWKKRREVVEKILKKIT